MIKQRENGCADLYYYRLSMDDDGHFFQSIIIEQVKSKEVRAAALDATSTVGRWLSKSFWLEFLFKTGWSFGSRPMRESPFFLMRIS